MKRTTLITIFLSFVVVTASAGNPFRYVNLFLGSEGDNGQMSPGAAVPFGMIDVCPDNIPPQHPGYDYGQTLTSGVSINRLSGVGGIGNGGNVRMKPSAKDFDLEIVKGTEVSYPGYYETKFSNGVKGRFTATKNMAVERYSFPKGTEAGLYVDFISALELRKLSCAYQVIDDRTIEGWYSSATVGARGTYKQWFVLKADKPFTVASCDSTSANLSFAARDIELRIAVSPVDQQNAYDELALQEDLSFRKCLRNAVKAWQSKLDKISVTGGDHEQKVLFYTSLYRLYLSPMDATTSDGRYRATDGNIYQVPAGKTYYSSWSMWDTFRTKFPMLSILEPSVMDDIAFSLEEQYRTGKKNWATENECVPTVRTEHSGIVILDAWEKGYRNFPLDLGYEGMKDEVANELPRRSPDNKLETSYDLWALSRIAAALGKEDDAERYAAEAWELFEPVWKSEFMEITSDFAKMRNNGLYQGSHWQYRWAAPQYVQQMVEWVGKEKMTEQLDEFFSKYLFNQGNEPDMHYPFLYNSFGRPDKTLQIVARLLTDDTFVHPYGGNAEYPEPYVGRAFRNATDGYAPEMDEDDGAMSAWYMFSQMGFYPLMVGEPYYELFGPYFDRITVRTEVGRTVLKNVGRKFYGQPVNRVLIDGEQVEDWKLPHSAFRGHKTVSFEYK